MHGGSVAEKSRLARATVSGAVALPWNLARNALAVELSVAGDFFSSLLLLCYCVLHVLRHFVHWTGASKQCVLQFCVAILLRLATQSLQIAVEWLRQGFSLLRVRAEYYCFLQLRTVNCKM